MKHKISFQFRLSALGLVGAFLYQLIFPTVSWALSGNQHQAEFMSYESFGSTDMVNLSTGDFTYNIPLLEIPGPEGSFQLPLAYHGGIGLEEEASWVGLGFSMNPGSINRTASSIPDDFAGEIVSTQKYNEGGSKYVVDVNIGAAAFSYDSERGVGGFVNIKGIGFGFGTKAGMSFAGISLDERGVSGYGFTVSEEGLSYDVNAVGLVISIGMAISSRQASAAGGGNVEAMGIAGAAQGLVSGLSSIGSRVHSEGDWTTTYKYKNFKSTYSYFLNKSSNFNSYGSLYLAGVQQAHIDYTGNTQPTLFISSDVMQNPGKYSILDNPPDPQIHFNSSGVVSYAQNYDDGTSGASGRISDSYEYLDEKYPNNANPNNVAFDNYSVSGPGISGGIRPFRLDVGSLAPKVMSTNNPRYHMLDFLPYDNGVKYKPQFKYTDEATNSYTYHIDENNHVDNLLRANNGFYLTFSTQSDPIRAVATFDLISSRFQNNLNFEADRADWSLKNKKLRQGRHVEWVTNWDLMSNGPGYSPANYFGDNPIYQGKIMDHLLPSERMAFRNDPLNPFPKLGIGGYAITNTEGVTYHYTLPIYARQEKTFYGKFDSGGTLTDFTRTDNLEPYAVHWLLTGITGSDFVDRGGANNIPNGTIDEEDWGYWVKLDYGKFASNYYWSNPYLSNTFASTPGSNEKTSYSQGFRESYYLNEIQTRSHRALFVKGLREDGRSSYNRDALNTSSSAVLKNFPSSSLKLNEIILLTENDYQELKSTFGLAKDNGDDSEVSNEDTFEQVWDNDDIDQTQRGAIEARQLVRHQFNYWAFDKSDETAAIPSELLCNESYNSFSDANHPPRGSAHGHGGKLTLKSVSQFGKNDVKLMPDYLFEYSPDNPNYDIDKFDGWGMYKESGTSDYRSHRSSEENPSAYCLTNITDPSGKIISVSYERDHYGSIAGEKIQLELSLSSLNTLSTRTQIHISDPNIDLRNYISNNQIVKIGELDVKYNRQVFINNTLSFVDFLSKELSGEFLVSNVTASSFDIATLPAYLDNNRPSGCYLSTLNQYAVCVSNQLEVGSDFFIEIHEDLPGGNNRVQEITIEGNNDHLSSRTDRYVYKINQRSSGTASYEPEYVSRWNHEFANFYNFPKTPIMYSMVSILHDYDESLDKFKARSEFHFEGLKKNMIDVDKSMHKDLHFYKRGHLENGQTVHRNTHSGVIRADIEIKDKTALLGKVTKQASYNSSDHLISETEYDYKENNNNVGTFSQGTILLDRQQYGVSFDEYSPGTNNNIRHIYRFIRTREWNVPYYLSSVVTNKNGMSSKIEHVSFDPITGAVLETEYSNSKGELFKSKIVPAYSLKNGGGNSIYPGMGSKFDNPVNKNMLNATAAEYLYVHDEENDEWDPIKAEVQTWSNNWNYRNYNATDNVFEQTTSQANDTYRKQSKYIWNGEVEEDGRFTSFVDFNWSSTVNANWLKTSENTLYDHYSHLLEARDLKGRASSSKMSNDNSLVLAQASNAAYIEFAFSGAEGSIVDGAFGGEVFKGNSAQIVDVSADATHVHTGKKALKLTGVNQVGFEYKTQMLVGEARKMRASVWVHEDDLDNLVLEYSYLLPNDSVAKTANIQASLSNTYLKAGEWHLLVLNIPGSEDLTVATANQLKVKARYASVSEIGNPVYIDDFRVHPFDGNMTATVYDEANGEIMASIGVSGLAEKFEYDASGRLVKVYNEVPDYNGKVGGFKLRKEYDYGYKRAY